MVKVSNKDTLRLVTHRFMKINRKRNIIAIIAIVLTALLFTSLFTGSESLILSKRATDIRQFMESSHAAVQDLTKKQAERTEKVLEKEKDVRRFGRGIFLGAGRNKEFNFSAEVRFGNKNMAESFNCQPTSGHLPEKENEIAVSSLVLDSLGLSHKTGQNITITWEKNGETHETRTDTFTVSGYWKGDKAVMSQILWVSEKYAKENAVSPTKKNLEDGIYNGGYEYAVWYRNLWNLEKKTTNLSKQAGLINAKSQFEVNPAYDLMEEDAFSYGSALILLLFIILAGYLIIYNVFSLSVKTDIRTYGLLKNIGTTGKQLKKIVHMQAIYLSAIGIPIGIVAGYGASVLMAPSLNATIDSQQNSASVVVVNANVLIFFIAEVFTLLTVYLSCMQSCRMVEKVSPVEALRLSENDSGDNNNGIICRMRSKMRLEKRKICLKKYFSKIRVGAHLSKDNSNDIYKATRKSSPANKISPKKNHLKNNNFSTNWFGMAVKNMLQDWKKGLIVMLSIALSMVVVNCIFMLVNGYDISMYEKALFASDFKIDQMTDFAPTTNFHGISPKVQQTLEKCPYSKATGYVYYSQEKHNAANDELLQKTFHQLAKQLKSDWSDYEKKYWSDFQKSKEVNVHFLGINKAIFDKLDWKNKPCSWEKFQSGNTVIVDYSQQVEPNSYYNIGDTFSMQYSSGDKKNYTVLGEATMPYAIDYPYADILYITVMVPESEFKEHTGIDSAMYTTLDAKKGQEKQVQKYLNHTILKENNMLNVSSVLDMRASFQKYVNRYYSIGTFLVIILLGIGIMNFFNTTATSVLSRKRELTLLEAVGMTRKQIIKMLIAEGCIYFIGAFVLAVLIICTMSERILSNTIGQAFFFQMHLTILPCLCMIPLFLIIAIVIPYYQYQKMSRETIVERLRIE